MSKFLQNDKSSGGEINLIEKLSEDLEFLYLSENFSDVTFIVDDERIPSEFCSFTAIILDNLAHITT